MAVRAPATGPVVTNTAIVPYEKGSQKVTEVAARIFSSSMETWKFGAIHLSHLPIDVLEARSRRLAHYLVPLQGKCAVGVDRKLLITPFGKIGIEIFGPTERGSGDRHMIRLNPTSRIARLLGREQVETLFTNSIERKPTKKALPIVIFSHGLGVNPAEYAPLLEEVASNGFTVVSINHPSSSGYAPFSGEAFDEEAMDKLEVTDRDSFRNRLEELAEKQKRAISFVVQQIRDGSIECVDSHESIFVAGHSLGGAASILVAREDSTLSGCINLDGGLHGESPTDSLTVPTQMIFAGGRECPKVGDDWYEEARPLYEKWDRFCSHKEVEVSSVPVVQHTDFSITNILEYLIGEGASDGAIIAQNIVPRIMECFMKVHS